jgi:hypothetical protein
MFDFWLMVTFCGAVVLLYLWRVSGGDPVEMVTRILLIVVFLAVVFGGAAALTSATA